MIRSCRGTAMTETAIVVSMAMLVLSGTMQLAIAGYSQASTEGAAFVGAHAASVNASGTLSTDQAYGLSVAKTGFPGIGTAPSTFTMSYPTTNSIQVIVTSNAGGLLLVPGAAQTISTSAGVIEPILADQVQLTTTTSGVAIQAKLVNYCASNKKGLMTCPIGGTSMYIAQFDNIDGNGNGSNGQFAEWNCRPGLFPAYGGSYFPTIIPKGGAGSAYDPSSATFGEASLYAFDSSNQWGSASSC